MIGQEIEEKQIEYFLPPEEVEECYGANFAAKLLIHQKEIFQDWYAWKRGKGKGLLVKRWMGEDTTASDSEEETNGLSHRFFEDFMTSIIEFTADDRNALIDFILTHIGVKYLNKAFTNEELTIIASNLFNKHPLFKKVDVVNNLDTVSRIECDPLQFFNEAVEVIGEVRVIYGLSDDEFHKLLLILDTEKKTYAGISSDDATLALKKYAERTMKEWDKEPFFTIFVKETLRVKNEFCKKYGLKVLEKNKLFYLLAEKIIDYDGSEQSEVVLSELRVFAEKLMMDWGKKEPVEAV